MIDIEYPIEAEQKEGRIVLFHAGVQWTDEKKVMRHEGITLRVPSEALNRIPLTFVVMSVSHGAAHDTFELWLHAHGERLSEKDEPYNPSSDCIIDAGGDVETKLTISIDALKKWTELSRREIDNAFGAIKLGSTYNILASLPRTITLHKDKIVIVRGFGKCVDSMNVCSLLLEGKHPIDK